MNLTHMLLKIETIMAYGGKCECCGEREPMLLTLDHVDRDGQEHRQSFGGTYGVYRDLKARHWPWGKHRVLCMNCNWGSRLTGVCPHRDPNSMRLVKEYTETTDKLIAAMLVVYGREGAPDRVAVKAISEEWGKLYPDEPLRYSVTSILRRVGLTRREAGGRSWIYLTQRQARQFGWSPLCSGAQPSGRRPVPMIPLPPDQHRAYGLRLRRDPVPMNDSPADEKESS